MAAPTAETIRPLSKYDFDEAGYPEGDPDPLEVVVSEAVAYIENVTARSFAVAQPSNYDVLMLQAARMRTEQIISEGAPDQLATAADIDLVASFSAGTYSETRRDQGVAKEKVLNPWPALDRMLWLLLTLAPGETNEAVEDRYDHWRGLLTGAVSPAWGIIEVDWADNALIGTGGYAQKPTTLYPSSDWE